MGWGSLGRVGGVLPLVAPVIAIGFPWLIGPGPWPGVAGRHEKGLEFAGLKPWPPVAARGAWSIFFRALRWGMVRGRGLELGRNWPDPL